MSARPQHTGFRVDTNLFRELGARLVGRNSTALVELVKNSYDADATSVTVSATNLDNPASGSIALVDNGIGMTQSEFQLGFLTIAGRTKESGTKRSLLFGRRYTGAKGVGRLAAHKLARELTILSLPGPRSRSSDDAMNGIVATIDWDVVESFETLSDLADYPEVGASEPNPEAHGTTIELSHLRGGWTSRERDRFLREVTSFTPPDPLTARLPSSLCPSPLLFDVPTVRDASGQDPGFAVHLEGDFARGDEFWPNLWDIASWVIEIDATDSRVLYAVAPTHRTLRSHPHLTTARFEISNDPDVNAPTFQARIAVREGAISVSRDTVLAHAGIRVYMEGFRVLPYGERGNDWLELDRDVTARSTSALSRLDVFEGDAGDQADREGLSVLPNSQYHGAVFLTEQASEGLEMLVNREGFIPNGTFDTLVESIRRGIDLSTRLRARIRKSTPPPGKVRPTVPNPDRPPTSTKTKQMMNALDRVQNELAAAQSHLSSGEPERAVEALERAAPDAAWAVATQAEAATEQAMLRVLASLGTQMSTVIHEMGGIALATRDLAAQLQEAGTQPSTRRQQLAEVERGLRDLQHAVERQAAYLTDVISADARRRRTRQSLHERLNSALRLIASAAAQRHIQLDNQVPTSARTPPMFPAEVTAVFANLLTNAVKAAGAGGRILATGDSDGNRTTVRIENTGTAVDLSEADRWFDAFESTTADIHPELGQGMGLGLTIVRRILDEYRATVEFVPPSDGFATAILITFS